LFEPLAELELEKVFVKMIDELDETGTLAVSHVGHILMELAKEYPKESIFLLSEIAKYSKSFETRKYAVDILSELTLKSIKPAEKPEAPEISEIKGETTGG